VDEADLHRAAVACLESVLFWRITNEIDIPMPSRLRAGQDMIELTGARALSRAISDGRGRSSLNDAEAAPPIEIAPSFLEDREETGYQHGVHRDSPGSEFEIAPAVVGGAGE
jgi:hypothetical protein